MAYRILHFADLHLDAAFVGQGFPVEYGVERRLDLRAALTRILARARELKVNAISIGGDFFAQEYLLPETADFILQQLTLLAPIRVIIAPGGKDPFTNDSIYARLNWPDNVDIFYQSKLTHLELSSDIHLWGACNPPARGQKLLDDFRPGKGINILLMHAALEKASSEIHTLSIELVQKAGFNLALLGSEHIGDKLPAEKMLCIYPGSPEPLSPAEEDGPHQVVLLEIEGQEIKLQPLSFQQWHYRTIQIDLTAYVSMPEAVRQIDIALKAEIEKTPHAAITVVLVGQPHFDLNLTALQQQLTTSAFLHLKSQFDIGYDLEQLSHEQTVRGLLVQRFLARINTATNEIDRRKQLTALNLALQALEGKQVSLYEIETN